MWRHWAHQAAMALVLPFAAMQGDWIGATLRVAWAQYTLLLVLGFLAATVIRRQGVRLVRSRAPMRGTFVMLVLHIGLLPLVGTLQARGSDSYQSWLLFSSTFGVFVGITVTLVIVFDGICRWLRMSIPRIAQDLVAAAAYLVGGIFLLSAWGVNLSGLIATSAVLTAVIGFSLQDTLGNLMAGMALQMERSIRPGDWLELGDVVGRVVEVRWRQTSVETRDWETVVVPNSQLAKAQFSVLGRRKGEPVQWRRTVRFDVDYRFPPPEVIRLVEDALRRAPITGVAPTPKPDCVLMDMRGSTYSYSSRYWLTDLHRDDPTDSLVRTRIAFALKRGGVPLNIPAQTLFVTTDDEERRQRKALDRDRDRQKVLRNAELFHHLSDADIDELANGLRFAPFVTGEVLTRQGAEGHDLFFIHRGKVSVRVAFGGGDKEVTQLGPGTFFGERSLLSGQPRSATVVALSEVVCYCLPKPELEKVLKRRPELAEQMAEILARRAAEADQRRKPTSDPVRAKHIDQEQRRIVAKIRDLFGL